MFYSCGLALTQLNFHSPSSKFTMPKTRLRSRYLPMVLSFLGLMIPHTDSKHLLWPAAVTLVTTLVVESIMGAQGTLPFWFYSFRHYIAFFYLVTFFMCFMAMHRLKKRRANSPHEFVDELEEGEFQKQEKLREILLIKEEQQDKELKK